MVTKFSRIATTNNIPFKKEYVFKIPMSIKNKLLDKLLNEWLDEWKKGMPERWLERFGKQVPQKWLDNFKKVSFTWLEDLLDTRDAIYKLGKDVNKWDKLCNDIKRKYRWVENITVQKMLYMGADSKSSLSKPIQNPISWEDFLSKAIELLLEKNPRYLESIEFSWDIMVLQIEAILDDLVPSIYKKEIYGRYQPGNWEDFCHQAILLLITGKRQWNRENYPTIEEQIKSVISSLVSTAYTRSVVFIRENKLLNSEPFFAESEQIEIEEQDFKPELLYEYLKISSDEPEFFQFVKQLIENEKIFNVRHSYKHRINIEFTSNKKIADALHLSTKEVKFLIDKLKNRLKSYKNDLLF